MTINRGGRNEAEGIHAFDMLMQDLNAQIAQASKDRDSKATDKAKALQAKATATGDLKDTGGGGGGSPKWFPWFPLQIITINREIENPRKPNKPISDL